MSDIVSEAHKLYAESVEATSQQRAQIAEDLEFSDPSNPIQWDDAVKRQRENDPGGARPCLVMDRTGQYVDNVAGQVAKSPPGLHVVPVDSKADRKVAEQLDGLFRHIEYSSRAQMHYSAALRSAARTGVGYLCVRPEYVNRALKWQEPRICAITDPLRVVFDPWCNELDGKDANFGFLLSEISIAEFERKYGEKTEPASFGDEGSMRMSQAQKKSVVLAEQWEADVVRMNMIVHIGQDGEETALREDDYHAASQAAGHALEVRSTYTDKVRRIKWRQMSGEKVLEESEYPADQIGLIPTYGYWGISGGQMAYCGIPRRAMNAQRSYNYHVSEQLAYMGNAPKAPWLASVRSMAGLEALWDRASLDSRAYLPFRDLDEEGAIAAPTRPNIAVNLQNHMAGADQALRDIEASIGMYQAQLGAPSNEISRVAIDGRKESGETSTSHFPLNLSSALGQVGRICVQMIPRLMDTKRRQRILGVDMSPGFVTIDPEQTSAVEEKDDGLSINPNVGTYDVRIAIGTAYTTQRSQAQMALSEIMRNNPELTPAIAPIWAQNLDIPNSERLAQVLTAMSPPAVQAILNPDASKQPKTADLLAQNDQLKQGLKAAVDEAHSAQRELDECEDKLRDKTGADEVARYNAETARLKVTGANTDQISAVVNDLIQQMLDDPRQLPGDAPPQDAQAQPQAADPQEEAGEPGEPNEMNNAAPTGPSPDVMAILDAHGLQHTQLMDHMGKMIGAIHGLAGEIGKPRVRIPVKDKNGDITHVIEKPSDN